MKRSTKILLWLGFLAIFFIPALWYKGQEIIIGGDLTFPLQPDQYFLSIFDIWRRVYTGGNSAISLTTLPFYAPMALFSALGFSLKMVQQLHFGLWLAAPAIGMFYLTGLLFRHHPYKLVGQIVAVLLYLFNTYEVVWADSARMAVWLGLPLMLAFFIQGLEDKKHWLAWASALAVASVLTSTAAANPPMFLMFLAIFIFYLIYLLLTQPEQRTVAGLKHIGLFLLVSIALAILINLFWIVPYAHVLLREYSGALSSGLEGIQFQDWLGPVSTNTSLLNVFRLQGAWDWYAGWQGEVYVPAAKPYQHNPFYLLWSVIVPVFAFAALLLRDKLTNRKLVTFFALLSLVGLLFSAGSHEPTGKIYKWLIDHVPFLSIYRSPWYKFSTWTVLGYTMLSAMTAMATASWVEKRQLFATNKGAAQSLIAVGLLLFTVATLTYSSGLVLGKVFPTKEERIKLHSAHITFPDHFFKAADWANAQPGDWRIWHLPAQEAFNYNWGLGTLMDMSLFTFNKPTLWWPEQTGSGPAKPGSESVTKAAYDELYAGTSGQLSRLLGLLNVRYALQKDDIDYSFYGGIDSPDFVKQKLTENGLTLAHQEGPWHFFESKPADQKPLIYPTSQHIQTSPAVDDLLAAIFSPIYSPAISYDNRAPATPLPQELASGRMIRPDLSQAVISQGNRLTMPLVVPTDGTYTLNFATGEAVTATVDGQAVTPNQPTPLTQGDHTVVLTFAAGLKNLVNNGSLEQGLWEEPFDASKTWPGQADFSAKIIPDGIDGKAAQVTSRSHSAALRRGVDEFDPTYRYLLTFSYRHHEGNAPKYTVWQEKAFIGTPSGELEKNTDWTTFQTVFRPRPTARGLYVFLYADPGMDQPIQTTIDYDALSVIKLPRLLDTLGFTSVMPTPAPTPTLTYERQSTTKYRIKVAGATGPFILNFLDQFDEGWQATIAGERQPLPHHFSVSGYANGWAVTKTGDYDIILDFQPQHDFERAALVSTLGLLLCLGLILLARRKTTTHSKRKGNDAA